MSDITQTSFSAIDYKGQQSLSSYALSLTPLRFVSDLNNTIFYRVLWNFGDGTTSKQLSPSKSYEFPGVYTVNLIVYDCTNNAQVSQTETTITIYDYNPFTFNIDNITNLLLSCGKIQGPYTVSAFFPPYQESMNIFYSISGSNSSNYWDTVDNKYSHLENVHSLYERIYNYTLGTYQYQEIDKISLSIGEMYGKIENDSIVLCSPTDNGSELIGLSGTKDIFIKDDSLSDLIHINFFFDKTKYHIPTINGANYFNNLGITLSSSVVTNTPTHFSVTSNGLDGEGFAIDSFDINPIKYYNVKIPFVVKIKDVDGFSVKNFDVINLSSINITLSGSAVIDPSYYNISSLNYTLSSQNSGGAFRGYIQFVDLSGSPLTNIRMVVVGTVVNDLLSSYSLTGYSTPFTVYPSDYYDFYKKNEDFNAEQTLKDLRFQETLLDKEVLFGDFLGGVLGDDTSTHEGLGRKIYEKIANFVQNTQDIDKCEIDHLDSLGMMMDYNSDGEEIYIYPETIKRIINTISIDKPKLFGTTNKFRENLDIRGRTSKDVWGKNIGSEINPFTYTVSAATPIVALEKFSNDYTLLNTYQPISSVGSTSYKLSTYSSDWGWPLVLPTIFDFSDIEKYYLFFEYNDQYDGTILDGIIDFENPLTTISISSTNIDLNQNNGIFDNIILDTLYQSLSLN